MPIEWVLTTAIILQLTAAYLALRLIPVTARRRAWILISAALLFMALRRGIVLVLEFLGKPHSPMDLWGEWVSLLTSGLLLAGIAWISPMFRSIKDNLEALKESEERHSSFFANSMDAVVLGAPDGRLYAANPAASAMFGYDEAEMRELGRAGLFDSADLRLSAALSERSMTGKFRGELTGIHKSGVHFPVEVSSVIFQDRNGQPRSMSLIRDVTQRRQAEHALQQAHDEMEQHVRERTAELSQANEQLQREIEERRRSEAERLLLATAIKEAGEGIIITSPYGNVCYVNPAFERMSGYGSEELVERSIRVIESGKHAAEYYQNVWETLERGELWRGRFINRRKDGDLFEVEATITPIRDAGGEVVQHVAVERDVTERVRLEKELRRAQQREAMGRLAKGIAHDFNNLLGTIICQTEMAQGDLVPGQRARSNLDIVLEACMQARDLVNQILAFSRQHGQESMPTVIAPILRECLQLLSKTLPENIELRVNLPPDADAVMVRLVDPSQIHQVLWNLCRNSADAMGDDGGTMEVVLARVTLPMAAAASPPSLPPGRYLRLTVIDTGFGMDMTEGGVGEWIFDPFFTTKPPGRGIGLGLAVVYGIVSSLGGAITVESDHDKAARPRNWSGACRSLWDCLKPWRSHYRGE
jgi:PAS domain S-box-containing protein